MEKHRTIYSFTERTELLDTSFPRLIIPHLKDKTQIFVYTRDEGERKYIFSVPHMLAFAESMVRVGEMRIKKLPVCEESIKNIWERAGITREGLSHIRNEDMPVLLVGFGPEKDNDFIIVDGNHRIVKRWERGLDYVYGYYIPDPVWRMFLVDENIGIS